MKRKRMKVEEVAGYSLALWMFLLFLYFLLGCSLGDPQKVISETHERSVITWARYGTEAYISAPVYWNVGFENGQYWKLLDNSFNSDGYDDYWVGDTLDYVVKASQNQRTMEVTKDMVIIGNTVSKRHLEHITAGL